MKKSILNILIILCAVIAMASLISFLVFFTLNIALGYSILGCKICLGVFLITAMTIIGLTCIKLIYYHIIKPILDA